MAARLAVTGEAVTQTLDAATSEPASVGSFATARSGRYVVESELARGSYGRVMRAQDLELHRTVALKELLPEAGHARARFEHEALLAARLQHPSIIPVYDTGCWDSGVPFIAMKLVTGATLQARIASGDRLALIPVVVAVAEAIAYAHGENVVHRDLKPANILVGEFGEVVVIDWGLAAELGSTRPTASAGTPGYLAPEQAAGAAPDPRADVFALGAILHHVLAGEPPVPAKSLTEAAHATPRTIPDDIPAELRAIVDRAMQREPSARYPSAKQLAADLVRFQTGQLVSVHTYSAWSLLGRFVRKHRAAVAIAATLLLAIAIVGAISIVRIAEANRDAVAAATLAQEQAAKANEALAKMLREEQARKVAEQQGAASDQARVRAESQVEQKDSLVKQTHEELVQQNLKLQAALRDAEGAKQRAEASSQEAARTNIDLQNANAELQKANAQISAQIKKLEAEKKKMATELK